MEWDIEDHTMIFCDTYSLVIHIFWETPAAHQPAQRDPKNKHTRDHTVLKSMFIYLEDILSDTLQFSLKLLKEEGVELTVKLLGGGSSFMRRTAVGGTGNTPPGTGCRPGAVRRTRHQTYQCTQSPQRKNCTAGNDLLTFLSQLWLIMNGKI